MALNGDPKNKREGPSTLQLLISLIGVTGGLVASGVATYNAIQSDLTSLKRGEVYQERVNEQMKEEIRSLRTEVKEMRTEQREDVKEVGKKVDTLIEYWPRRKP